MPSRVRGAVAARQALTLTLLFSVWVCVDTPPLVARQGPPDGTTLEQLLARAAKYVVDFETAFSNVVAEERYVQRVIANQGSASVPLTGPGTRSGFEQGSPGPSADHRELRSDFLLAKLPGEERWIQFRDVFEVDGTPVRDREERLTRLFLGSAATALARARQITTESTRYNIGNIERTINLPLWALEVLHSSVQPRFRFSGIRRDTRTGVDVYAVSYQERTGPTLVQGVSGRDLFARGQLWIESRTGRVLKSEFIIDHPPAPLSVRALVTTLYRNDPTFTIAVPVEMREEYRFSSGARVTGVATYGHFRRFSVDVDERLTSPPF
jgi:hypothetical protein